VIGTARMTFKAGDEFALKLSKLASGADEIAKKAIYEAAGIVADKITNNAYNVMSDHGPSEMMHSFGIAPIKPDESGNLNTKLGFDGYDSKGVPNQLKARVLESGSSNQKKRPFVRPAVNATKQQALTAMGQIIDEEIKKRMGG